MLDQNRLTIAFASLRAADKKTVLPFITAGYPDLDTTIDLLAAFRRQGVRVCELGIPFSDPVADGPVIQASYTEVLGRGLTGSEIFQAVAEYRRREAAACAADGLPSLALMAMVSYSIIFRHGPENYLAQAAAAGIDALIVPDLPLEESAALTPQAQERGLCNILLVSPMTPPPRRLQIAKASRGFLYYISVAGITGERKRLPEETIQAVADLRRQVDIPICIGFGISSPQTVAQVCSVADGAIVGSAIVHRIADAAKAGAGHDELVARVADFVGELLAPLR
jgi:tryptophan synthase alpha chain